MFASVRICKIIVLWCVGMLGVWAPAHSQNHLLYQVQSPGGAISYLFGTYHLMDSSFVEQHPSLRKYVTQCQAVVGELVMNPAAMMSIASQAMMPGDTTLKMLLTPEQFERVAKVFKNETGYELMMFNKYRPVMVEQTIGLQIASRQNGRTLSSPSASLDGYFQEFGKRNGLEVMGLESVQDQVLALFFSTTVTRQAQKLVESLERIDETRAQTRQLDSCYVHQNLGCLYGMIEEAEMDAQQLDALLNRRNRAWMETLESLLREKPVFIAVGALHLPGDAGLLQLLKQAGFVVTPVEI